jgi:hypothetical protein
MPNKHTDLIIKKKYNTVNYGLTKKVALFTNARNEKHIKEWASHHLLIGFDLIFIFDHKSNVPLSGRFKNFDKRVKIINVSNLELPIKLPLMKVASNIGKKYNVDWILYLDCDEFLILNKQFVGVKHFLNHYNFADSLGVNWLMFGSNNLVKDPNGLILENYTKSELLLNQHVKTFVRPNEVLNVTNPHFYIIKNNLKMYGINNKVLSGNAAFNQLPIPFYKSPAYIAHYVTQSEETYIKRKGSLPADDTGKMRAIDTLNVKHIHSMYNTGDNLQPKIKYAEQIKKFLAVNGGEF